MSEHTPGPWEVEGGPKPGMPGRNPYRIDAPGHVGLAIGIESEADANLFAAAPDLLEAAKAMLEYDDSISRKSLRKAIAKAEGR